MNDNAKTAFLSFMEEMTKEALRHEEKHVSEARSVLEKGIDYEDLSQEDKKSLIWICEHLADLCVTGMMMLKDEELMDKRHRIPDPNRNKAFWVILEACESMIDRRGDESNLLKSLRKFVGKEEVDA